MLLLHSSYRATASVGLLLAGCVWSDCVFGVSVSVDRWFVLSCGMFPLSAHR